MNNTTPHFHQCVGLGGQTVSVLCHCSQPAQPDHPQVQDRPSTPERREHSPATVPAERFAVVAPDCSGPTVNEYRAQRAREANAQQRSRLEALRREYATTLGENPDLIAQIDRLDYIVNRGIA